MATCLFTGAKLCSDTKLEHVIPRCIGGRITSRTVSSNEFNNRCGASVDNDLALTHRPLMVALGPLIPTASRVGLQFTKIEGSDDQYIIDGRGVLSPHGSKILSRNATNGRPTGVAASSNDRVNQILGQNLPGNAIIQYEYLPSAEGRASYPSVHLISPQLEIGILKSVLLCFDHLLSASNENFARADQLALLRNGIRDYIVDCMDPLSLLKECSLGIQYEKEDLYGAIRSQVDLPKTEFEHVLIVSAHPPTWTLDAVFWLFGMEPYGFRLSSSWRGQAFTKVVCNGVLSGASASEVIDVFGSHILCVKSPLRAICSGALAAAERDSLQQKVVDVRIDAIRNATFKAIMEVDEWVKEMLSKAALPAGSTTSCMSEVFVKKLVRMYEERLKVGDKRAQFDGCVEQVLATLDGKVRADTVKSEGDLSAVSWIEWIGAFRRVITELVPIIGLPGDLEFRFHEA